MYQGIIVYDVDTWRVIIYKCTKEFLCTMLIPGVLSTLEYEI